MLINCFFLYIRMESFSYYLIKKYFYENQLLLSEYDINSEKVKEYFELNNVIEGFYKITGILFNWGLNVKFKCFRPAPGAT